MKYVGFTSWSQLLDHIRAGYILLYQAPMGYSPAIVNATIRRDRMIRVIPIFTDADPFTADIAHLPRFRRISQ